MSKAFGYGVATIASNGDVLDTWYPVVGLGALEISKKPDRSDFLKSDHLRGVTKVEVDYEIDTTEAPKDAKDAYLRLHLLSHRLVQPHGVNLDGVFTACRAAGRHMLAREYGRIVNISSIMAVLGRGTVAGYVSAKHGMTGLTKNLAAEFGPHVTANAIAPGYIRTELNVPLQQDRKFCAMLEQRTAAHRWGTPADLRGALLLLASNASAYITGHTLVVDGGMTTILA